jgi:hypothetical protein
MNTTKVSVFLTLGLSFILIGAGCQEIPTDVTQITPEHVENAKQYVEEKERILDDTTNKINELGKEVEDTSEMIKQQQAESETLKQKLTEQEEQRELDLYCNELSKVGSKYLPTKQPLKELYEALQKQNSEAYFEEEYASYVANYEQDFERDYDHYVDDFKQQYPELVLSGCDGCDGSQPQKEEPPKMMTREEFREQYRLSNTLMTREEYRGQWLEGKQGRDGYLAQLKPHYDEYMVKCL